MKLSDYVAEFLAAQGIRHVFAITSGASIHLIHSIADRDDIDFVCPHHEQAGAMAADAYSRVTGNLGAALATSGPGATNMITGICCAWFDSVPVLYITGQVATFRRRGETGVRQMGFQETQIVDMVRPVTKHVSQLMDPQHIRYELEKAVHIAREGRPGPVVVDIPDDLQRSDIDPEKLEGFTPPTKPSSNLDLEAQVRRCVRLIASAERPVLVIGWGVRLAGAVDVVLKLADKLGFPVLPSWAAMDMFPENHPLLVGSFGTHGTRYGNFTVQNADLVLAIGARLSTRETGSPVTSWACSANTIIVDIDQSELDKFSYFGKSIDEPICADADKFARLLNDQLDGVSLKSIDAWWQRVSSWIERYPVCPEGFEQQTPVNPYVFVRALADEAPVDEHIFAATGCAIAWIMQAFQFKLGQRLFHAFNNTPMGYALPAAIGGCLALGGKPVTCIEGDGSLMLNLQELATIKRHRLPVRLFVVNNSGYSMVKQTQDQWLGADYHATSYEGGLDFPDFSLVAQSFDIPAVRIEKNSDVEQVVAKVLESDGPILCDVVIPPEHHVVPQCRYGRPIEDAEPLLEREEFLENMIVEPMAVSLE